MLKKILIAILILLPSALYLYIVHDASKKTSTEQSPAK